MGRIIRMKQLRNKIENKKSSIYCSECADDFYYSNGSYAADSRELRNLESKLDKMSNYKEEILDHNESVEEFLKEYMDYFFTKKELIDFVINHSIVVDHVALKDDDETEFFSVPALNLTFRKFKS